jgi:DNA-binding LacI/PurR family transcriptional regulator
MEKEITIKDVAKKANVSISTVSRVLNGLDRVSKKTRSQVLEIIKELNYVPNNLAVSMVKKRSKMIAVMVPDIINPFYTAVIQGAEEIAKMQGYLPFVYATNDNPQEEIDFLNTILSKGIDGIITISSFQDYSFYQKLSKPVVIVDRYIENCGMDAVVIDNYGGAYQAVTHLIENGHKNIAIINGPQNFNIGRERFRGYQDALKDNQLKMHSEYIKQVRWFVEDGYQSTFELLDLEDPPTAIFASNNMLCRGVIKALQVMNKKIGDQISLVGFDDNELATFNVPNITVIDRPTYEMGIQATRILLEKMKGNEPAVIPKLILLGTKLIHRESVKNIQEEMSK